MMISQGSFREPGNTPCMSSIHSIRDVFTLHHTFKPMTRPVLLSLLALLLSVIPEARAQSWCPPGATWNYHINAWMTDGSVIRTYTGDTMIDGWNAQCIHEQGEQLTYWNNDTILINRTSFTSVQDSVIYLRGVWGGMAVWDTLFRFDAQIGDRWFPPGADSVCMDGLAGMLEVMDTATVIVDGLPLRTWDLAYLDGAGAPFWEAGTVIERLGYLFGLTILPGTCIIIEYGESLRCYEDDQMEYHASGWTYDCSSTSGFAELATRVLRPVPNPGTDTFCLELAFGQNEITILDGVGRVVAKERVGGGVVRMDTASLVPGVYLVRASDGTATLWMKSAADGR